MENTNVTEQSTNEIMPMAASGETNFASLTEKTTPASGDMFLMEDSEDTKKINYDKLADAILNKLTSKTYSGLETTAKNFVTAINELNSKTFQNSSKIITSGVDWNTITDSGVYKVQCIDGFEEAKNAPMISSSSDFYNFGILLVFKPVVDHENRLIQIYIPDIQTEQPNRSRIAIRCFNASFRNWGIVNVSNTL